MEKEKLCLRLRKIEGQIRGLQKMILEERDCEEVLTQFASISGALKSVGFLIIKFYINNCLKKKIDSPSEVEIDIQKLIKAYISSI